jgi:hypothetical protein
MSEYIDAEIDSVAKGILEKGDKLDDHAYGKLTFLLALRRVYTGRGTPQDLGLMDAVNDFLQSKGIISRAATFLK